MKCLRENASLKTRYGFDKQDQSVSNIDDVFENVGQVKEELLKYNPACIVVCGSTASYIHGERKRKPNDLDVIVIGGKVPKKLDQEGDIDLLRFSENKAISIAKSLRYNLIPYARAKLLVRDVANFHVKNSMLACMLLGDQDTYHEFGISQKEINGIAGIMDRRDYSIHETIHGKEWWLQLQQYAQERRGFFKTLTDLQKQNYEFIPQARIGVVGYCPPTRYDKRKALVQLEEAFDKVEADFSGRDIVVVSGATTVGVLAQAYQLATVRGYQTGGVACEKAADYDLFPMTEKPIIVGKEWGAESPVFVNGIDAIKDVDPDKVREYLNHPHYGLDAMVRIGVGVQSIKETTMIRDRGKPTYEFDLPRMG